MIPQKLMFFAAYLSFLLLGIAESRPSPNNGALVGRNPNIPSIRKRNPIQKRSYGRSDGSTQKIIPKVFIITMVG